MMKGIRRITGLLLTVCLAMSYAPDVRAAEIIRSGKSGDIDWSIDSEGCLTLSGNGDYQKNEWAQYGSEIKTAKVDITNISALALMFNGCTALTEIDFQNLDASGATSIAGMFYDCKSLTSLDLSGFDTSNVKNMGGVFYGCSSLREVNLDGWDTSQATDMQEMFYGCSSLEAVDVSGFDTGNVTDMNAMFYGCNRLTALDLSSFHTAEVISVGGMFCRCENLAVLNMENSDLSKCESMTDIFTYCRSLEERRTPYRMKVELNLPSASGKEWRDEQGNVYTQFPVDTDRSILLALKAVRKKGDINADGSVSMTDLLMCLHHVSGRTALVGDAFLAADINGDGAVKMTDLMRILHYVSGRNTEL